MPIFYSMEYAFYEIFGIFIGILALLAFIACNIFCDYYEEPEHLLDDDLELKIKTIRKVSILRIIPKSSTYHEDDEVFFEVI